MEDRVEVRVESEERLRDQIEASRKDRPANKSQVFEDAIRSLAKDDASATKILNAINTKDAAMNRRYEEKMERADTLLKEIEEIYYYYGKSPKSVIEGYRVMLGED